MSDIMSIPETWKKYYSKYNVCLDLEYSIYMFRIVLDNIEYKIFFSSEHNLNKFKDLWENKYIEQMNRYENKYNNKLIIEKIFYILNCYVIIEKRGFRILKNGNQIKNLIFN